MKTKKLLSIVLSINASGVNSALNYKSYTVLRKKPKRKAMFVELSLALFACLFLPLFAHALAPLSNVSAIAAGDGQTCAILSSGAVQCWGSNEDGEVGDNSTTNRWTPVAVSGLNSGISAITAGGYVAVNAHTCALLNIGAVQCWGANNQGQLGDNSTTDRWTPVAVNGLSSGVSSIVAGGEHTCALLNSGAVQCWGANNRGQLGDNSTTDRSTPVAVNGLSSGVSAIVAGGENTCALLNSGAAKCWGANGFGQLGDNTTTQRLTPVAVSGLSNGVRTIVTDGSHTCALLVNGAVQCWGYTASGQPGDEYPHVIRTPIAVSGLSSGVSAIAAGHGYTCALLSSGALKCWGFNGNGALGDGTKTTSSLSACIE